jgi:hypothetical protein
MYPPARDSYYRVESKKHYKLSLLSKGLQICKDKPTIGASVDNIRTCKCNVDCQDIVVEYKCPWKHRDQMHQQCCLFCLYYILVHVDISKDEPVTLPKSATKEFRSITVMNIDNYETCIRKLEPRQMINDNINNMLLK